MGNITKYPLQDGFETTLAQNWDGQLGTISVNQVPDFTFPAGITTYVVVDPLKTTMQVAEIDSYNPTTKTLNVTNITLEKGAGINSTANIHLTGSTLIISDNYEFWKKILDAVNSKMGLDETNVVNTGKIQFTSTTLAQIQFQNLTTIERTTLGGLLGATDNLIVKDTTDGEHYKWNGSIWETIDTGTPTPNASETVAGKVEQATKAERDNETDIGSTGAPLFVVPSLLGLTGEIKLWSTTTAPTGWVICDGSAISRTTFADLFALIGTTYGEGDLTTTFNIPDCQGKIPIGRDSVDAEFDVMGETGGEKTHILTTAEMPNHAHTITGGGNVSGPSQGARHVDDSTGNIITSFTGSDVAHNNLQPYIVLNYIIKT